jgi:REP element-mobilizing transposase RayT
MPPFDEDEVSHELYVHIMWSTYGQKPIITSSIAYSLYHYIGDVILHSNCSPIAGKIFTDHLQFIIKFNPDTVLEDLITDIKLGSTLWLKTHCPDLVDFAWQTSDFCFTVSYDHVGDLADRIAKATSFVNEIATVLSINGMKFDPAEMLA